ncbi:MAG: PqqD family protein [Deltaproteobacteria bacterium]|nr:MAG: PqqD family protein [Deltaproteobacteria bacterium]
MSSQISRIEALKCTPIKNVHVKETRLENGAVLLTYPVAMRPWITGLIRRFGGHSERTFTRKLQLDDLGTHVWDLIDGINTVQKVIQRFAEKYQFHLKEAEVSVTRFLRELGRRGIIGLQ